MPRRTLTAATESWDFREPFTITGYTFTTSDLLVVSVTEDGSTGRGEAAGVYYLDETGESMLADVEKVRAAIEAGADRLELLELLPPGGARNALDCALWDLEAKHERTNIWALTGIEPGVTRSVLTIGIGTPEAMAAAAKTLDTNRIKVKLDAHQPVERLSAVRKARPDAEIVVDVNQGWTFAQLQEVAPVFAGFGVAMIEQPLPRGGDAELEGYRSPVPLCADESCLCLAEFEAAARRYQVINIKLDKSGGLTEALELAHRTRERGLAVMVGNMMGTSLAMAPGYVVAQLCRFVDLDGATFLKSDREAAMTIRHGVVSKPRPELWG
ncbi:MAG TPA: N-acetyl-D-Glu racemase DgcA [Woeseiaceae bacterium]|nr:N-acetyl-D-Glu racemase DgcA [Woeseiaceae bacterium]